MKWIPALLASLVFLTALTAAAAPPSQAEMAERDRWMAARFPNAAALSVSPVATVDVRKTHDWIFQNSFAGQPFELGGKTYYRGLFAHAPSELVITLPGPAKTFIATAGVGSNRFSRPAKGSVVMAVRAGDKNLFRSEILKEGMAAEINVNLSGARQFMLIAEDGGDGNACDTALWTEARVVLEDGQEYWLGDMPITAGEEPVPYTQGLPFSFVYDGKPSAELLPEWSPRVSTRNLDASRLQHTLTFTDPNTKLQVRCEIIRYLDFPTVEWTAYFKNTGTQDTPIIESIRSLDMDLQRRPYPNAPDGEFLLHHWVGSPCSANDYAPRETLMEPGAVKRISGAGGRPTNSDMSYFNLEWGSEGLIVVVGWPGQWAAEFARDKETGIQITAGQELTHLRLHPGEEIRTPSTVLQFWKGDWVRAQNVWRSFMMNHAMPKPGGKLPEPMLVAASSRAYMEMTKADEASQIMFIKRYLEEGLRLEYWWMDAGWYPCGGNWPVVGTWDPDPERFPNGFKPISDFAHSKGIKIVVWFEPERVHAGTWLPQNHPEWVFGGKKGGYLNLGNPDALKWLTDHVDKLITENGIDLYRQDFNMDPLGFWRGNDAEDRQGMTEMRCIEGYLAYWDELQRRHPDMLIDSCASGGRRNDFETMRRSVPLWRSDYAFEPIGTQCMTYGVSFWLPFTGDGTVAHSGAAYYGAGSSPVEPYAFWSNTAPSISCGFDLRQKDLDYAALRQLFKQYRSMKHCYYGDYYPLTPHSTDRNVWIAWQFHLSDKGEGVVQAFRRDASPYEVARFQVRGLDETLTYSLESLTSGATWEATGDELMQKGIRLAAEGRPGAEVVLYKVKN